MPRNIGTIDQVIRAMLGLALVAYVGKDGTLTPGSGFAVLVGICHVEDVPELALHFLRLYSQRMNKQVDGIDDDAMIRLKAYPWPGNVRQLENVVQRAVVVAEKPLVTVEELPVELQADHSPFLSQPRALADVLATRATASR